MAGPNTSLRPTGVEPALADEIVFLTMDDVARRVGLSRRTLEGLVNSKKFPVPVDISTRRIAFVESEVVQWQHDKMQARAR